MAVPNGTAPLDGIENGDRGRKVVVVFLGPDAEGAVGENYTKVQFRRQKADQIHHTRFHRHAPEQLGQGKNRRFDDEHPS